MFEWLFRACTAFGPVIHKKLMWQQFRFICENSLTLGEQYDIVRACILYNFTWYDDTCVYLCSTGQTQFLLKVNIKYVTEVLWLSLNIT